MKHLRKFNESKDEKMINTIKDILIEFEDRGFSVKVYQNGNEQGLTIIVENWNDEQKFINIDEDNSIFEMLFEYLEHSYELYLIRYIEKGGENSMWNTDEYELRPIDQENEYETFHEVLKNRELRKIILFYNASLLKRLQK